MSMNRFANPYHGQDRSWSNTLGQNNPAPTAKLSSSLKTNSAVHSQSGPGGYAYALLGEYRYQRYSGLQGGHEAVCSIIIVLEAEMRYGLSEYGTKLQEAYETRL